MSGAANGGPLVTIAIPCRNEEHHIEACLRDVMAQDWPPAQLEVLVADGRSDDKTREIVSRLAAEDPRVRLIDNPARIQAAAMNEMLREARGDVIIRMDVHARYANDYVRRCVEVLSETGADNVGGAQRAVADTPFQRALCAALESPLGVGGARYRSADAEGFVDTVFLGAWPRATFEKVGLYDPGAITNEDAELNQRIVGAGGRIYLSRRIVVHYKPRESYGALSRQYFKYGVGRARTLLKHGTFLTIRPALPFLMVVGGALLILTSPLQPLTLPAFALYAAGTALEAVRVGRRSCPPQLWPVVWGVFPVLHASHGVGFATGLWRYLRKPDWPAQPDRLAPRPALVTAAAAELAAAAGGEPVSDGAGGRTGPSPS